MKTLVFFTENLSGGGVEKIQQIILKQWDYEHFDVTLFSLHDEGLSARYFYPQVITYKYIFESIKESDGRITRLRKKSKNKILLIFYYSFSPKCFYRLFIRKFYDIGIAFIEGYATRVLSGAPSTMNKVAWIHTELQNNHWTDVAYRSREEEKKCYKAFRHLVCVSKEVKRQMDRLYGVSSSSIVVYNPIDIDYIIEESQKPIEHQFPLVVHPLIVTLGRLENVKGYSRLLNVMKRLRQDNNEFELWLIGDGKERESLSKQIKEQLEGNVRLLGYKENPYPYLRMCDFYVCSSYAEGYNTAITEALVLGKPVVSTDCSGVREQLGNSQYGIITKNDEDSLYEGIKEMMNPFVLKGYTKQVEKRKNLFNLEMQMNVVYQIIEE